MLAASLAAAIVVSLPVILSVAVRYRFAVRNNVLSLYAYSETEPSNIIGFLLNHVNAGGALAVLGAVLLAFDRERRQRAWVAALGRAAPIGRREAPARPGEEG